MLFSLLASASPVSSLLSFSLVLSSMLVSLRGPFSLLQASSLELSSLKPFSHELASSQELLFPHQLASVSSSALAIGPSQLHYQAPSFLAPPDLFLWEPLQRVLLF